jgi:ABC-2 type transport system permease protein
MTAAHDHRFGFRDFVAMYAARLRIDVTTQIAYRGAVAIWLLGLILQPLVALVVWTTVADSRGGMLDGLASAQYAGYFIALMVVDNLTFTWVMYEFEWRIQSGFYSSVLLRPVHPIHQDITQNLSFKLVGLIGVVPAAILLTILFDARFGAEAWRLLALVPAVLAAMTLRFLMEWALALLAFWVTRTSAMFQLYNSASLFLAGNIAPLWLLPDGIQAISWMTPFRWTVYFPVAIAIGRADGREIAIGFAMQALWIAIFLLVVRTAWRSASSRYAAVGG